MPDATPLSTRLISKLPRRALTRAAGRASRWRLPAALRRTLYASYAAATGADLDEAALSPAEYETFESFFVRALRDGARPWTTPASGVAQPSDGRLDACGRVERGRLIQAKGLDYAASELLAGEATDGELEGAAYATIYLSPADYHRVHVPAKATWVSATHIGGELWPVNVLSVPHVDRLFCVNERVVCTFRMPCGSRCWVVLVGATVVGMIDVDHPDFVPLEERARGQRRSVLSGEVAAGDALGAFRLGSTVVVVLEGAERWEAAVEEGARCRVGAPLFFPNT